MNETILSPWMTTEEAAAYARLNPASLRELARRKRIQFAFDGKKYRFLKEWLDNYLFKGGWNGKQS